MNLLKNALALGLVSSLAGCAGEHIVVYEKCITCVNNPITGEPVNHDGSLPGSTVDSKEGETLSAASSSSENASFTEQKINFDVPVDVDVAFIKVKREYNYYTEQEIRQEWGSMAETKMRTFAYAYDATPSVYYRMRAHRKHGAEMYVIDHQIEKTNNDGSQVIITVWVNDNSPLSPSDVADSLAARTKTALNL